MIRRRILFSGRVQGVGFRATTAGLARRLPLTGFVRNLTDGRVELVAQGEPQSVDRLLEQIDAEFPRYITGVIQNDASPDATLDCFEIRL